ncbi:10200_t:CDS:2 [Entrophospora sp. SA101]|nr:11110_t:CDS:2 [Entrophospora sp. SA101]CAJ0890153.1 10200_t:CDS:2 [Entrophospora sp. SA101]
MVLKDKKTETSPFLNENIPFSRFLLINGEEKENITKQAALTKAKKLGLDLFCVAPHAKVRISFNIGDNDLRVKLGKVQK